MVQPKCPSSSPQVRGDGTGNAIPAWDGQGQGRLCGMDFGTLGSQGHVDLLCRDRTESRPVSPSQCPWWPDCDTTMGPCELTHTLQKHPPQKARSMGICCPLPAPIPPRGHIFFLCSQRLSSFGKLNNKTNKRTKKKKSKKEEERRKEGSWERWYWPITVRRFCTGISKWTVSTMVTSGPWG